MKLHSIQYLRALAVGLVVYAHSIDLQVIYGVSRQQNFRFLQNFGAIGVDLFFVISGFVITLAVHRYNGRKEARRFLTRRFIRINPLYYLASLLYGCIAMIPVLVSHKTSELQQYPFDRLLQTLVILPLPIASHHYLAILRISWTLAFEWMFYGLFFIALLSGSRRKTLVLSALVAGLVLSGWFFPTGNKWLSFVTSPIMLEFLLGVVLCGLYLYRDDMPAPLVFGLLLGGVGLYICLVLLGYGDISESHIVWDRLAGLRRFIVWGIPSALLASGCVFLEKKAIVPRLWNNRWMLLIGDASYSIYLTHLSFFFLLPPLYHRWTYFPSPDVGIFIQLAGALLTGVAFYQWVERPLLRYAKNYWRVARGRRVVEA